MRWASKLRDRTRVLNSTVLFLARFGPVGSSRSGQIRYVSRRTSVGTFDIDLFSEGREFIRFGEFLDTLLEVLFTEPNFHR
ncbi:MAG: hypothetical protein J07HR59_00489, partial [Halorubrum sp. J07HR59]